MILRREVYENIEQGHQAYYRNIITSKLLQNTHTGDIKCTGNTSEAEDHCNKWIHSFTGKKK